MARRSAATIEDVVNSPKHKGQTPVVRGDTSSTVTSRLAMLSSGASFSNSSLAESRIRAGERNCHRCSSLVLASNWLANLRSGAPGESAVPML